MSCWQKKYHSLYLKLKEKYDFHVIQLITEKEEIIASAPFSFPLLKHNLRGIRRFKTGKLRIFYAVSTEREFPPKDKEVIFLYVDLRKEETYTEALKLLRKHKIL